MRIPAGPFREMRGDDLAVLRTWLKFVTRLARTCRTCICSPCRDKDLQLATRKNATSISGNFQNATSHSVKGMSYIQESNIIRDKNELILILTLKHVPDKKETPGRTTVS